MDIVKYSINKPVSVTVGIILVVMFGLIGLNKLPVQLTPDVETPEITVSTTWGGATPYEIEKETQELLSLIRTDLDAFHDAEACVFFIIQS